MGIPLPILLTQLNSRDITEYMAFSAIEPFGFPAEDLMNALLCYVTASCWTKKKWSVKDWSTEPKEKSDGWSQTFAWLSAQKDK